MNASYPLLSRIDDPRDLRALPPNELPELAQETRAFLIETVSGIGGHFAAGLGVVELTLALHYVYDTPRDLLVWDVGHQAYPHKILTGRRDLLRTIRQSGGLAPFPVRQESPYDSFGVGHAGTAVGAALGFALAHRNRPSAPKVVAVIGDGGLTAGMAFEALNHAGAEAVDLLVILNDNEMSISKNVGALSTYSNQLLSGRAGEAERKPLFPRALFEALGFTYEGPIDGHDLKTLLETLSRLKMQPGPQFLHVVTRKGKGFPPAEADPVTWHGPTPFDAGAGTIHTVPTPTPTYSEVFGQWIIEAALRDRRVVAITPAMREGSGLAGFAKRFPDRYHDVGIAEQHAVTLAAGLAAQGLRPVVAIYSTFLQRAYDQLIHDVALQRLPVLFAIDRAGIVGGDGATHQGSYDIGFLRCIPHMTVMTPSNEVECWALLETGLTLDGPGAVRYPRGRAPGASYVPRPSPVPIGRAVVRHRGKRLALLAFGPFVPVLEAAARNLDCTTVDMRFVKPLDECLLEELAQTHTHLVTLEDHCIQGGAGSAVLESLARSGLRTSVTTMGLPDRFIAHGERSQILAEVELDADGVLARLSHLLNQPDRSPHPTQTKRACP
ncbi:MAG: 1-deoxy-D-xylulose-5-phosphate synthase [Gammaproteobacteria bacterium]